MCIYVNNKSWVNSCILGHDLCLSYLQYLVVTSINVTEGARLTCTMKFIEMYFTIAMLINPRLE